METKYDAIVVGTGVSGGWAAKELCEKGLKTLVLERGRMIKHIEDYPTMNNDPWDYESGEVIPNAFNQNKAERDIQQPNQANIFLLTTTNIHIMKPNVLTGCEDIMSEEDPLHGDDSPIVLPILILKQILKTESL
jgi:choline dehydrogenase-like flavoprotein